MCKMYKEKTTLVGCQNCCQNSSIVSKLLKLGLLLIPFFEKKASFVRYSGERFNLFVQDFGGDFSW